MLTREWLDAFVPIGILRSPSEWVPLGAGVLFLESSVVWLITANHVLNDAMGQELVPLVSKRGGGTAVVKLGEIQRQNGYHWHRDQVHDIAATLMPVSPDWEIKAIDEGLCIKKSELIPSMPCFTVGCPYGVTGFDPQRATPLVLDGIIAGVDPGTGELYTSAPTFPGNSGGPIIVRRDPFSPAGGLVADPQVLFLAGIILQVRLVNHPDPSSAASLPPLLLGFGISIETALDLIRSEGAMQDQKRVLEQ